MQLRRVKVRPKRERPKPKPKPSRLSTPYQRPYMSLWVEIPLLLLVAFCAAVLVRTFLLQAFHIPSGSMEETLQIGDRVLVVKLTDQLRPPQRGEVVVFRGTDQWDPEWRHAQDGNFVGDLGRGVADLVGFGQPDEKDFIKRIIAVGGDTVECCDPEGRVMVNGVPLEEDYVYDDAPLDLEPGTCHARRFDPVEVPEGHLFMLGDHRGDSQDSRCQGPVPIDNVIGRAVHVVWPADRTGPLEIPDTFEQFK
ncbi:signal peptidase I [Natronoglycomyces albus]|uniref:Signal peptidase I n=2 Tax=Natronoglycomyces albus TaxID=2811108 RepID=A0A895XMT2_9ACTN|nr:signal peptidase I [Natronoglycomyces albus]